MESLPSRSLKRPSTKGQQLSPLEYLAHEHSEVNPAIVLADELMRRSSTHLLTSEEMLEAERVMTIGLTEIARVEGHLVALKRTPGSPATVIPVGF